MTKRPEDCTNMEDVRVEIDRLDTALVDLLAERWQYVDRAWQFKTHPEDATVPWRIQQVIDKVTTHATAKGLPPALVEAVWRQLIGWAIQHEEAKLRRG